MLAAAPHAAAAAEIADICPHCNFMTGRDLSESGFTEHIWSYLQQAYHDIIRPCGHGHLDRSTYVHACGCLPWAFSRLSIGNYCITMLRHLSRVCLRYKRRLLCMYERLCLHCFIHVT